MTSRPRVVHLNGAPGVGKSTLARRYVTDHPDTLDLDIDVLRTLVGGWDRDFGRAGLLVRPVAMAAMQAHLRNGHDVVLPQLTARPGELAAIRDRVAETGARHVHVVLVADAGTAVRRFADRVPTDGWHDPVGVTAAHVEAEGGETVLRSYRDRIAALVAADPDTLVLDTTGDDADASYAALLALLPPRFAADAPDP